MNSIADGSVIIQTSCQSVPSTPPWFGEVALLVQYLRKHDILSTRASRVRFARRRFAAGMGGSAQRARDSGLILASLVLAPFHGSDSCAGVRRGHAATN